MTHKPSELWALSIAARRNSYRWNGDADADVSLMIRSLHSEVNKLLYTMEEINRGEVDPNDAHNHYEMGMKLADIFACLLNVSVLLKCDLLRAYELRVIENEHVFQEKSRVKERVPVGWVMAFAEED